MEILVALSLFVSVATSLNSILDTSFEDGDIAPTGWQLSGGDGSWEEEGHSGQRSISVSGDGSSTNYWFTRDLVFQPKSTYHVSFWSRVSEGSSGGCAITGANGVNHDYRPTTDWRNYSFILMTPSDTRDVYARFGQWNCKGKIWFDDVTFTPVKPINSVISGVELGYGERVQDNQYVFRSNLSWRGNYSRTVADFTCGFNTNRWTFNAGQYLIYRHSAGDFPQKSARVAVRLSYYLAGECVIEASADSETWHEVGKISALGSESFQLPPEIFPCKDVFIRIKAVAGDDGTANFQVYGYEYTADLGQEVPDMVGETHFVTEQVTTPGLSVAYDIGMTDRGYGVTLDISRSPECEAGKQLTFIAYLDDDERERRDLEIDDGASAMLDLKLKTAGDHTLKVEITDDQKLRYRGNLEFHIPELHASDYGYLISSDDLCDLWWCEATYKVSRERPVPDDEQPTVMISAAKNEYEPFQLVLRPKSRLEDIAIDVTDLVGKSGTISKDNIDVLQVYYSFVKVPTDNVGSADYYPDALPPIDDDMIVEAGRNQPFWILVYVPADSPAGDYSGRIRVKSGDWERTVDLKLHVWDFALSDESHVQSAFGFSAGNVKRYHRIEDDAELAAVLDKYYQSFREHRISPYYPMAPIRVSMEKPEGVESPTPDQIEIKIDFSEFDRTAERYLDEFKFNSFRLPLMGLGGGTFHSRYLGNLAGFKQGTPEHEQLFIRYASTIEKHLEEKGWLDKAYVYWFDEPDPKDYQFVKEGMELIRKGAPKLTRMLTEEPVPELYGSVDLWCPVTYNYDHKIAEERRALGERFWWYVCTGPKAPYCTLFIDHPAIELRMWLWQTWKYRVDGILVWQTNYWTSNAAFPDSLQNPYEDPMGYVSGYGRPPGYVGYWGNGDGRFVYPPKAVFESEEKCLDGPVSSIRWEMLREGIEDYEYLWTLRDEILRARERGVDDNLLADAESLLTVPDEITESMTKFTKDPRLIYERRAKIAQTIERIRNGR